MTEPTADERGPTPQLIRVGESIAIAGLFVSLFLPRGGLARSVAVGTCLLLLVITGIARVRRRTD